ncbi:MULTISPECIES: hypothetical protein [unclassified Clostridioides]|uniref:hypothetical protein n=1 Tax=unclassified Clostridioides TaxID=2635829 RepID=UPI001D10A544|nr:hypothetical protein [Clostridioides sp. ES-S-0001-02]MCC0670821.1 hypothetical protein [Clostridioides sp. ES-S-0145-01]UDN56761.1 hypothetical protein JJC01_11245 [Clostridioides sp. ES-S-0010-02]
MYDILTFTKMCLGITNNYHDERLKAYIIDVKSYLNYAGVEKKILESEVAASTIARGVTDLWDSSVLSSYFMQRATQLACKKGVEESV